MRQRSCANHHDVRVGRYTVVCKCPAEGCGRLHKELWDAMPIVTPRRYCPEHVYLRGDEPADYNLNKRTGYRKARS